MADRTWLLRHEVTGWFSRHCGRAQAAQVAVSLGISRRAAYDACSDLQEQRLLVRRTDQRGRVWFAPRPGCPTFVDSRKTRIVTALAGGGPLTTAQLCASFGEHNTDRGYRLLKYYREQGLVETVESAGEARWQLRRDDGG